MAGLILAVVGGPMSSSAQTGAQSVGNPDSGASMARRYCSNCHVVSSAQQTAPTDGAPTFHAIAANPNMNATSIRLFIEIPHPRMANQVLSRTEIADIVAYILSLRAR
ncbi:MAG: c-type cytochrome [Alphaproteobacteria bacterium]